MKLSTFLLENIELVLQEWENFAKTIFKSKQSKKTLRDHAKKMLLTIVLDLQHTQSRSEQTAKSKGQEAKVSARETAAEEHGIARLEEGFSINEIAAEYRALRASVTKLWGDEKKTMHASDIYDLMRFNEAIDQSLNESIASYALTKEQQARHFNSMLSSSPDLNYIMDTNGVLLYVNKAMSDLYQKPAHDMLGKALYDLTRHVTPTQRNRIQAVLDTGEPCRGDREFHAPSGRKYLFEYIYTPVFDDNGIIEAIAGNSRDITERKHAEADIWKSANYDLLTGLPNRRLFSDRLTEAMKSAMREDKSFALLSLDLDRFKTINDTLGHGAGDLLLQKAGSRIKACLRDMDTVARMGGDEFTVIIPNISNTEQIKIVTEKILTELAKPYQIKHQCVDITGSIGIALFPQDGVKLETLLGNADRAMYIAKKSGGNRFSFHADSVKNVP